MDDSSLRAIIETAFTTLLERGDVDIIDDDGSVEIQADPWTLVLTGWPITTAWIAIDSESDGDEEMRADLSRLLRPMDTAAMNSLNDATDGGLVRGLQDSGDELSAVLASVLLRA